MVIVNVFFAWLFWKLADYRFANGNQLLGWIDVAISATNAAAVLLVISESLGV